LETLTHSHFSHDNASNPPKGRESALTGDPVQKSGDGLVGGLVRGPVQKSGDGLVGGLVVEGPGAEEW
jgi:hypothetical protein